VSWCGATGMDAGRAPLRQGWRVGAYLHLAPERRKFCEAGAKPGPDVSAEWFPLCRNKGVDRQGETVLSRTANMLVRLDSKRDAARGRYYPNL